MHRYIPLKNYAQLLNIQKGDNVFLSSDTKNMLLDALENGEKADLNLFIDGMIEAVGTEGTIIFPTYNWDFCKGKSYHSISTPCKTGALGTIALKRSDFRRTRHPIYSFAVYGKNQEVLLNMRNTNSFGLDSPFHFFRENNVINYIIDVPFQHCFTFVHYVEEISKAVSYRYLKSFEAEYTYEDEKTELREYSMFVRDLDKNVISTVDPIEDDFIKHGAETKFQINHSVIKRIELGRAFPIILDDILHNNSRKICIFDGQE